MVKTGQHTAKGDRVIIISKTANITLEPEFVRSTHVTLSNVVKTSQPVAVHFPFWRVFGGKNRGLQMETVCSFSLYRVAQKFAELFCTP